MRTALRQNLEKLGSTLSWQHVTDQVEENYLFLIKLLPFTAVLIFYLKLIFPLVTVHLVPANRLACSATVA